MNTVKISASINEKKKAEFFQTLESLKSLVQNYCSAFDLNIDPNNKLEIKIAFNSKEHMEKNFSNTEFNILKGSVKSLCENVDIKFD